MFREPGVKRDSGPMGRNWIQVDDRTSLTAVRMASSRKEATGEKSGTLKDEDLQQNEDGAEEEPVATEETTVDGAVDESPLNRHF